MYDNQSTAELVVYLKCHFARYKYPLYGWQYVVHVTVLVCYVLMWLPTVVLNFAALQVYLKKKMRTHHSNLFILNTIIADFLTGLSSIPLAVGHFSLVIYHHKVVCPLYLALMCFGYVFTVVSFLMVSFAGIDRYLAIFKPFFYSAKLSHWSSLYYSIVIAIWLLAFFLVGSSILTPGFGPVVYFICAQVIVILINVFMIIKLWLAVRQVRHTIQQQLRTSDITQPQFELIKTNQQNNPKKNAKINNETSPIDDYTHRKMPIVSCNSKYSNQLFIVQRQTSKIEQENRKSVLTMSFMVASLCVCYLPYFTLNILWKSVVEDVDIDNTVGTMATFLVVFKAVLNPISYCYSMPSVKRRMKALFWKKSKFSGTSSTFHSGTSVDTRK